MSVPDHKKSDLISELAKDLDVDLRSIMSVYKNEYFKNTNINKLTFFRNVVSGTLTAKEVEFVSSRCDLEFLKDRRTPLDYGKEIAFNWIVEDIILASIQNNGLAISRDGNDQKREFLENSQISSTADFKINFPWGQKYLELVVSWFPYWLVEKKLDLRASKYYSMFEKESLCLGIDMQEKQAFCLDIKNTSNFIHRQNPAWGNKYCFTLENIGNYMKPTLQTINQINTL